jgi:hypothetical protein
VRLDNFITAKKYYVGNTILLELLFLYIFVAGIFVNDNPHIASQSLFVLSWVFVGVKAVLGYLFYHFYKGQNIRYKLVVLGFALILLIMPIIFYYSHFEAGYLFIGGPHVFVIVANTLFLFSGIWNREKRIFTVSRDGISIISVLLVLAMAILNDGYAFFTAVLMWLFVHSSRYLFPEKLRDK